MCISHKGNNKLKIYVDGQQVSQLRYLGSLISVFMEKKKL